MNDIVTIALLSAHKALLREVRDDLLRHDDPVAVAQKISDFIDPPTIDRLRGGWINPADHVRDSGRPLPPDMRSIPNKDECYLLNMTTGPAGYSPSFGDGKRTCDLLVTRGWLHKTDVDPFYYITDAGKAALERANA